MIGGLGPESAVDYYRSIIAHCRARKPNYGYPHLIINSLDLDKGIALLNAGRLGDLADYLAVDVALLIRAGADFGFNSTQRWRRSGKRPWLHNQNYSPTHRAKPIEYDSVPNPHQSLLIEGKEFLAE
jgi:hypothetical protein